MIKYIRDVVFLGKITSNANKVSDSRDETLWGQNIALLKIILKADIRTFVSWFKMYYPKTNFIK